MLSRFFGWIVGRSPARAMAAEWERRCRAIDRRLARKTARLEKLRRRLEELLRSVEEDVEEAAAAQREREAVVEALRSENEVLSRVLVPILTSANQLAQERIDADLAVQARRRAAAQLQEEKERPY